jgi:flagellar basal-body rod protein FlgC
MSAEPQQSFASTLQRASLRLDTTSSRHFRESSIISSNTEIPPLIKGKEIEIPNMKKNIQYDPSHPDADKDGYVVYPDINIIEEMVDLMVASRAFEANVTVVNAAKGMITKSLEI